MAARPGLPGIAERGFQKMLDTCVHYSVRNYPRSFLHSRTAPAFAAFVPFQDKINLS